MSRDADTRAHERRENARAAIASFVAAWHKLDSGLTDAERALFDEWLHNDRATTPDIMQRVKVRREIERRLGSPAYELCIAKLNVEDGAKDTLLAFPDSGVTFEQEIAQ